MALLSKAKVYDIEDSNIELLGSDLEKYVREHAGVEEPAWQIAGKQEGLQIWRIEKFQAKEWPDERFGTFYDGDSYLVLYTYKRTRDARSFSYDLHFWLGNNTTQDEAGTAAYKTVELDDLLQGTPVQWREAQGQESNKFLSHFPRFVCLRGGMPTGFHHVSQAPPKNIKRLYQVRSSHGPNSKVQLVVHEVLAVSDSLVEGDVYVLDKGAHILQLNTKASVGQERYKAAEFVQSIASERQGQCDITVCDEGSSEAFKFLNEEFGQGVRLHAADTAPFDLAESTSPTLYRISDASGSVTFEAVVHLPTKHSLLSSQDAFLFDHSAGSSRSAAIFVWIGKDASLAEKRMAVQYAQRFLHDKRVRTATSHVLVTIPIVKMLEGYETPDFLEIMNACMYG